MVSDADIEELIQWHKERAAWYESAKPSDEPSRQAFHRLRRRHEDTAELLVELASYRNGENGCCPHECCVE